ncbi:MAG: NUDIX domain-containing protein [Acidiferrobacterales bacterium]
MSAPVTPSLTVDTIIELIDERARPIVLIRRKFPPLGWALPGGFVDVGETVEAAAVREAREETALDVRLKALLGCYSDPTRDPRRHTATIVYLAEAHGQPCAQDDAKALGIFATEALPGDLAFDHAKILGDYLTYRRTGQLPIPRP